MNCIIIPCNNVSNNHVLYKVLYNLTLIAWDDYVICINASLIMQYVLLQGMIMQYAILKVMIMQYVLLQGLIIQFLIARFNH